jgi:alpha-L-fucosidase
VWRPGETDVSIRPGWFYHPAEDANVRSVDNLVDLYFTSVGRNSKLLLNVPPTREGLLHEIDVERLAGMRTALLNMLSAPKGGPRVVVPTARTVRPVPVGTDQAAEVIDLATATSVSIAELREAIGFGQVVSGYRIEGSLDASHWQVLSEGTTIGHCKLDRFSAATVRYVRLFNTAALAEPQPLAFNVFR